MHDDPRHPDNLHDKLRELLIEQELRLFLTTAAEISNEGEPND